jgi:hypothetical protein
MHTDKYIATKKENSMPDFATKRIEIEVLDTGFIVEFTTDTCHNKFICSTKRILITKLNQILGQLDVM